VPSVSRVSRFYKKHKSTKKKSGQHTKTETKKIQKQEKTSKKKSLTDKAKNHPDPERFFGFVWFCLVNITF